MDYKIVVVVSPSKERQELMDEAINSREWSVTAFIRRIASQSR